MFGCPSSGAEEACKSPGASQQGVLGGVGGATEGLKGRLGTYMRGELGAVELTLWDKGGVSVRSFMARMAMAGTGMGGVAGWPSRRAGGGRTASC